MKPKKEEILAMEPGRELDALVLELVFGFPRKKLFPPEYWEEGIDEPFAHYYYIPSGKPKRTHMIDARMVPSFSMDIAAAWQVLEKIHKLGWCIDLSDMRHAEEDAGWWFELNRWEPLDEPNLPDVSETSAHYWQLDAGAATAPLAICYAALQACSRAL